MSETLGCTLFALLSLGLGAGLIWAVYALVRAHRFVTRAEARLARLEARLGIGGPVPATGRVSAPGAPAGTIPSAPQGHPGQGAGAGAAAWSASTAAPPEGAPEGSRPPEADRPQRVPPGVPSPEQPSAPAASRSDPSGTPSPPPVPGPAAGVAGSSGAPASAPAASSAPDRPDPTAGSPAPPSAGGDSPVGSPPPAGRAPAGPVAPPPPSASSSAAPWYHDLEERLGAKLPVWLGAVALALAGAFLVKYSVDQGWIGPPVRVGLGVTFGIALLAGSGLLRRSAGAIAGALAASGVAVLYAAFLAAVHLYGLVTPIGGFALMALTTAVAVGLSLVHGPIVAVIGLVGGLLTPYWIQVGEPDPKRLFAYLLLVHAGVLAVSRRRAWPGLSLASLAGGLLWVFAWLAGAFDPGDGVWLQLFLLAALVAWGATALRSRRGGEGGGEGAPVAGGPVPVLAAAVAALLAFGVITAAESQGVLEWSLTGVLVAALLVVARLRPELHLLAWLGAATVSILLLRWAYALSAAAGTVSPEPERFLWTTLLLGLLLGGGAWLATWGWRGEGEGEGGAATEGAATGDGGAGGAPVAATAVLPRSRRRGSWGALCAAVGVAHPVIGWLGWRAAFPEPGASFPWAGVALAVAAVYAVAALPVARHRRRPGMEGVLAALAVAVTALLSWAAALAFDREVLTLAWALEVAALAALAGRFRLPVLVRLAAVLAVPVVVRLAFNPGLLEAAAGELRLFNTLLWTHGLAVLAFAFAAVLLDRWAREGGGRVDRPGAPEGGGPGGGDAAADPATAEPGGTAAAPSPGGAAPPLSGAGTVAAGLRWGILLLLTALVALQVIHAFQPAEPLSFPESWTTGALQTGGIAVGWLALGLLLLAAARRWPRPVGSAGRLGSRGLLVLGLGMVVLGPCLLLNPLGQEWEVGATPVFNHLLWIYGLPVLLLALAARVLRVRPEGGGEAHPAGSTTTADRALRVAWSLAALLFLFVLVTLQVLQLFRGTDLTATPGSTGAEGWALSAAWLLLGMVLLAAGIALGRRFLRAAALAVTALAVVKVFLFDVARLGDLYRVLSFLGLGLSLLLLAWLYQRFVFRRQPAADGGDGDGPEGPPGTAGELPP